MRTYPNSDSECDRRELELLNAEQWQVDCLKMNPEYVFWGNFEDYMIRDDSGWESRVNCETIEEGLWGLDEYNEVVNFYFEVVRDSKECEHCEGSGLNEKTKQLKDDWYSFDSSEWIYTAPGRRYNNKAWQYHLTEVEVKELVKHGRLRDLMKINCHFDNEDSKWYGWIDGVKQEIEEPEYPTPEQVNEWAKVGFGHDSINQWIAVEARARQMGIYGHCQYCEGRGRIYTAEKARLALQLWVLHPRKGCSRGVYINNIKQEELTKVIDHLKEAAKRNAERFSRLP